MSTRKRLRVLVLADSRSFHTERYVRELRRQGCAAIVASLEHGSLPHVHLAWIGPIASLHYSLASRQVRRLVEHYEPDIVNPHFASGYGYLAARAIGGDGPPIVCHLWGSDILVVPRKSALHRRKTRIALQAASAVVGDSRFLIEEASKISPLKSSAVIPWGIEQSALSHYNERSAREGTVSVFMPRPHEKVYDTLTVVRALAPLLREGVIKLTVPRWGSQLAAFHGEVEALSVSGVHYYDKLTRRRYLTMAAHHEVFLSAARSDSSPASLIEAMGLGLIPIAADIPGVAEWTQRDRAVLFAPGDEAALRAAVEEVVNHVEAYDELRRQNHERVVAEAVFENNVARTIELMCSVAKV